MKPLERSELVDWQTWSDGRDRLRPEILEIKRLRRVEIGPYLSVLFENRQTVRWQVQEMMRVERIAREKDIQHELRTYNELLGGPGELGACLLIGIDDPEARAVRLQRWIGLQAHVYATLPDGRRVYATFDPRQVGDTRLSSVQYLRFAVGGQTPVAVGCDASDPEVCLEVVLPPEGRTALASDLADLP